jgi:hypothetical protein
VSAAPLRRGGLVGAVVRGPLARGSIGGCAGCRSIPEVTFVFGASALGAAVPFGHLLVVRVVAGVLKRVPMGSAMASRQQLVRSGGLKGPPSRGWLRSIVTGAISALLVSGLPAPMASATSPASAAAASWLQSPAAAPLVVTERVDRHSAQVAAHAQNRRVEIWGQRSETERLFANPDGSLTREMSLGVERVGRSDGTRAEVDLDPGGSGWWRVRPKGRSDAAGSLRRWQPCRGERRRRGGVWCRSGGARTCGPRIADNVATYPEVQPGIDLVVEVLRTGYEVSFMVRQRPTRQLSLPLTSPPGK